MHIENWIKKEMHCYTALWMGNHSRISTVVLSNKYVYHNISYINIKKKQVLFTVHMKVTFVQIWCKTCVFVSLYKCLHNFVGNVLQANMAFVFLDAIHIFQECMNCLTCSVTMFHSLITCSMVTHLHTMLYDSTDLMMIHTHCRIHDSATEHGQSNLEQANSICNLVSITKRKLQTFYLNNAMAFST